jgi:uncharacterized protein (TIGR03435 family)
MRNVSMSNAATLTARAEQDLPGLELEPRKGPVPVVVDHAGKMPTEN